MKIFEALRQDHEKQRLLLKILAETSGNTPARQEYFEDHAGFLFRLPVLFD